MNAATEHAIIEAADLAKREGDFELGTLLDMAMIYSNDRAAGKQFWKLVEKQAIELIKNPPASCR